MTYLAEGMRGGDLEDLVLPMISVDEFVSKVSDDAMVLAFFVSDKDAANDLNRFIQKSPIKFLDTEVSPAPDQRGFYVVFFEVMKSAKLPRVVKDVLEEIQPLVLIDKWKMQVRGHDDLVPFSEESLARYLKKLKSEKREKDAPKPDVHENVLDFLRPSDLSKAEAVDKTLFLEGFGFSGSFDIIAFGPASVVVSSLTDSPLDLSMADAAREVRIGRMLGEGWSIARVGGLNLLQHDSSDDALLLRDR